MKDAVAGAQPQSDPEEGVEIDSTDELFDLEEEEGNNPGGINETAPERSFFGRWKWAAAEILLTLCLILLTGGTYGVVATKNQEANDKNVYVSPLEEEKDCDDPPPCYCPPAPEDDRRKHRNLDGGEDDDGYGPLGGYDQNHRWLLTCIFLLVIVVMMIDVSVGTSMVVKTMMVMVIY